MRPLKIETLAKVLKAEVIHPGTTGEATVGNVSIDSRIIHRSDCFFAVKGENFDGHDYVKQAFEAGAACAVVQKAAPAESTGAILRVDNTVKALGELAAWHRSRMPFKVVAITGSAGKTTTREMAYHVLSRRFSCTRAPKSFNNAIGLPLTILSADRRHEIVIVEIGSNAPGEISRLASIAAPDMAMVTNIYPAHLEGFGNVEAIIKEKASIVEGLKAEGKLLINGDFEQLVRHCSTIKREFTTFGWNSQCNIRGRNLVSKPLNGRLTIGETRISVPLAGKANLSNALAAWAICKQFGITAEEFAEAISTFEAVDMRLQIQKKGPITIINDCYNANPASMANALDCLAQIGESRGARKIFICGTMAELGPQSENLHHQLGKLAAKSGVTLLLAAGDFAETVAEAARANTQDKKFEAFVFKNTDKLCNNVAKFVRPDDIILVKGSRSAKLEKAVKKLKFNSV
jgi:UDP-N-acetylmuramoyl-tripeptide--D-alanyl-D-alanine ligase